MPWPMAAPIEAGPPTPKPSRGECFGEPSAEPVLAGGFIDIPIPPEMPIWPICGFMFIPAFICDGWFMEGIMAVDGFICTFMFGAPPDDMCIGFMPELRFIEFMRVS